MASSRRRFLESTAGLAAGLTSAKGSAAAPVLPTIRLGKYEVSRLIIGANPFYGYSHFNRLLSQRMVEWGTSERICEVLGQCELNGINCGQFSHTERTMSDLKRHRV